MDLYVGMDIMSIAVSIVIMFTLIINRKEADKASKAFLINTIVFICGLAFDIASDYAIERDELLFTIITVILGAFLSAGFSYYCVFTLNQHEKLVSVWISRVILILIACTSIANLVSFFTGTLFVKNGDEYEIGFCVYLIILMEFASSVCMLIVLIRNAKAVIRKTLYVLAFLVAVPTIGALVEMFVPGVYISFSSITISLLLQYFFIQTNRFNENKLREQLLQEILVTDDLTGLKNRHAYNELIDGFENKPVDAGVAFFDVNGLKSVNDMKGHMEGDKLIIRFANLLKANVRHGQVFRISGDEFVSVYLGEDIESHLNAEAAAVKEAIKKNNSLAAIGTFFGRSQKFSSIVREAEYRMYADKRIYYEKNGIDRRKG